MKRALRVAHACAGEEEVLSVKGDAWYKRIRDTRCGMRDSGYLVSRDPYPELRVTLFPPVSLESGTVTAWSSHTSPNFVDTIEK